MDIIERSLKGEERYAHIARMLEILRGGLPRGQMIELLAGMRSDRQALIEELEAFVRPMMEAGVNETKLSAFLDAVSNLGTHDTLTVLVSAAAVVDVPAAVSTQRKVN